MTPRTDRIAEPPPLELLCGSWIATASRGRIVEVWTIEDARELLRLGWKVRTAAQHLAAMSESATLYGTDPYLGPSSSPEEAAWRHLARNPSARAVTVTGPNGYRESWNRAKVRAAIPGSLRS